jgi:hypothetical protein
MSYQQELPCGLAMDTAPRDREITIIANRAPIDETIIIARGRFNIERDAWVVEDKPPNGLPSLGSLTVNAVAWLPF